MPKRNYLFSLLSGAALTLAFSPFEIRLLGIILPALFFFVLFQAQSKKEHIWLSYLFALGLFATGASWIFHSMYFFSAAHIALAILLTSLFVILMALFFIPFGLFAYFLRHQSQWITLIIVFPAIWMLIEWFRSWFLTGFPWLYLAHIHVDNMLAHWAPIGGGLLVSWISAILSGLLLLFLLGKTEERIVIGISALIIIATSYGIGKIEWTKPAGKPLSIALLQGNIPQEKKWLKENKQPTIDLYMSMTRRQTDKDIIIWPETALPGYFNHHVEDTLEPLQELAGNTDTDIVLGGFFHNTKTGGSENSILAISKDERQIYSKSHLVPFSEYIPFLQYIRWLEKWIKLPYDSVGRGSTPPNLMIAGYPAQMSVCYEDAYGNETIRGLPEANFLVNVSNDGWFTGSFEPYQHMEIARLRAIETGRYMLRSTNIGVSGIVDNHGKLIYTAPAYTTTMIEGFATPMKGTTPFVVAGNYLAVLLSLLILLIFRFIKTRQ